YIFENGRRYHGYKAGRYMLPNDESEMDREDMKHHISILLTEGRLHLAPIDDRPQKILDIGTGTGIWAIDMADAYPSAQVIGTDLSPIQPAWHLTYHRVPPNLIFEIDDAEDEWLYTPHQTDFIHCRYLFHGIRNWPKLFQQAMRTLKPGGWIEIVEMHVIPSSYDNSLPEPSQIRAFYDVLAEIGEKVGINLAVAQKFKSMLETAGYEEVTEQVYDLPLGGWMSHDRRMREVGLFQQFQMVEGIHGIAYGLLTRVAGWSSARVEAFLAGVRREMTDPNVHCMYKLYFVYGRAPR
ncbi:S-adenosyl-L-methionine-dependent methyltransferase, partial [Xylogone sp. PMI_703]